MLLFSVMGAEVHNLWEDVLHSMLMRREEMFTQEAHDGVGDKMFLLNKEIAVPKELPLNMEMEVAEELPLNIGIEATQVLPLYRETEILKELPLSMEMEVTKELSLNMGMEAAKELPLNMEVKVTMEPRRGDKRSKEATQPSNTAHVHSAACCLQ